MARTEVRTIFYGFQNDIVMAVSHVIPWGITPHLTQPERSRTLVFALCLANGEEQRNALGQTRNNVGIQASEVRILVKVAVFCFNFSIGHRLLNDTQVFVSVDRCIKEKQAHQDERDDGEIFSTNTGHCYRFVFRQ